jgi:N utilization substance protein A
MVFELKRLIEQVCKDKGIDRQILIGALEEAIRSAAKKRLGPNQELEVVFNEELGEIEVFQFKQVVERVKNAQMEISLEEGRGLDPGCEIGDSLGTKMDASEFGRIAAQTAKQVIIQRMKEAERDVIYEDFKDKKGQIISGSIQRVDKRDVIVNLGRTEAILPYREQVPKENYRARDRIRAYVLDVRKLSKEPQVVLSRTHMNFITALFYLEVPEISEGIVKIISAAREPGSRSKIAVTSNDPDVDPVGACVGMRGARVQSVVHELRGEKIDIIPWNPDPAKFVCHALAPAEISRVIVDKETHNIEVIVPDEQLSLAIGKRGQNVRLASKLTGWNIDVKSESKYDKLLREGYESLLKISGIGEATAEVLYDNGFTSAEELAESTVEELTQIQGISEKKAQKFIQSARELIEKEESQVDESTVKRLEEEGPQT